MAIDRGGLDYTIEVKDKFFATTQRFQQEIEKSKKDLAEFEAQFRSFQAASRGLGRAFGNLPDEAKRTREEFEKTDQVQKRVSKSFAVSAEDRRRRFQALAAQQRQTQANFLAEEAAIKRIATAQRQLAATEKLRARSRTTTGLTQQEAVQQQALLRIEREKIRLQSQAIADQDTELQKLRQEQGIRQSLQRRTLALEREKAVLKDTEITKQAELNALLREERTLQRRLTSLGDTKLQRLRTELEVKRRIAAADQRAAVAAQLAAQGRDPRGERIRTTREIAEARLASRLRELEIQAELRGLERGNRRLQTLRRELGATEGRVNRLSFTFRRLFGILAAFAAARFAIQGFREIVAQSVQFNANLEQANLGIASLFVAVGNVANATGEAGTAAQQLALAQAEARRQTALLRVDAQRTAATFQQLLQTFQVAIAPGLTAGLDVDEIRKLTVQISQAAAAIGVPQNQLAEEIRSLLEGTIQARTTRIATALGITNDDIRRAKEAGELVNFLNDRFEAFSRAGEEALGTFRALLTNTQDAIGRLIGAGGLEFFNEIKDLLSDVLTSLQQTDEQGLFTPNPQALTFVQTIFSTLQAAVAVARDLIASLSFEDVQDVATVLSTTLTGVFQVLGGLIRGVIQGIGDLGTVINTGVIQPLRAILGVFGVEFGEAGDAIADIVAFTTRWLVILTAVNLTVKSILGIKGAILGTVTAIRGVELVRLATNRNLLVAMRGIAAATLTTLAPVLAIVGALVAAGIAVQKLLSNLFGIELKFKTVLTIVSVQIVGALQQLAAKAELFFTRAFSVIRTVMIRISDFINDNILAGFELVLQAAEKVLGIGGELLDRVRQSRELSRKASEAQLAAEQKRLKLLETEIKDREEQIRQATIRATTDALESNENAEDFADFVKRKVNEALGNLGLGELFPDVDLGLGDDVADARALSQVFEELPAQISGATQVLTRQADLFRKLEEEIRETGLALQLATQDIGLTGGVQQQARILTDAQLRAAKETREIDAAINSLLQRRTGILTNQESLRARIVALEQDSQALVSAGIRAGLQVAQTQNEIAEAEKQTSLARLEVQAAQRRGDQDALDAAVEKLRQEEELGRSLRQNLEIQKASADALLEGLPVEQRRQVVELIDQALRSQGELAQVENDLLTIAEGRADAERQITEVAANRLALVSRQETFELQQQTLELQAQVDALRNLAAVRAGEPTEFGARIAQAENVVRFEETRLELLNQAIEREQEALDRQLRRVEGTRAEIELLKEREALQERNKLQIEEQNLRLDLARQNLELQNMIAERPVTLGIAAAFQEFTDLALNKFETTLEIAGQVLNQFADTVSQMIVAAFDPNEQGTTRERFQKFFQSIFTLFVNFLVRLAIAYLAITLIPGLKEFLTLLGNAQGAGGGFGGAEGGQIPKKAQASPWHYKDPKGLAAGGKPTPPKGVDKRDTVPIWAQPGEWMMRLAAVKLYGTRVMQAINEGRIDPGVLRGLASQVQLSRAVRQPKVPSFQTGGRVSSSLSQSVGSAGSSVLPVLVGDDETVDRLTAGGRTGFIEFFNEEDEAIRNNPRGNPGA